jgi:hypothetical protein
MISGKRTVVGQNSGKRKHRRSNLDKKRESLRLKNRAEGDELSVLFIFKTSLVK